MSCLISEEDSISALITRPTLSLTVYGKKWPSIRPNIKPIGKKKNIKTFGILKSHVALRTKEDKLPVLSAEGNGMTGKIICYIIHFYFISAFFSVTYV
jgi:hypothetical protein